MPAPLAAVGVVSLLVIGFQIDLPRVGDLASIEGGLPTFHLPLVPLSLETLYIILPYSLILAAIGLIESLLTLNVVADMTETKGDASRECLAQGVANTVTGFFGGMGGCAMIGQSVINVKSGGRTRLSGIAAALFLLTFILFASDLIEQIPLAALVGVMFMVVIGTFAWKSLTIMRRIPTKDALLIVLVTAVTVMTDLAIAVLIGVILSALFYAWNAATRMGAAVEIDAEGGKIYTLQGPLFFGSAASFLAQFKPHADPDRVVIDFVNSRVVDHSGLQAIDNLAKLEDSAGKIRLCLMDTQRSISFLLRHLPARAPGRDTAREILRDVDTLMSHIAFLFDKINFLMDSTVSFINIEQNQIIKIFSIAAVVFLPPTLIASIYGMNFEHMPELAWQYGYPLAIGLMIAAGIAPYLFFKHKGWL